MDWAEPPNGDIPVLYIHTPNDGSVIRSLFSGFGLMLGFLVIFYCVVISKISKDIEDLKKTVKNIAENNSNTVSSQGSSNTSGGTTTTERGTNTLNIPTASSSGRSDSSGFKYWPIFRRRSKPGTTGSSKSNSNNVPSSSMRNFMSYVPFENVAPTFPSSYNRTSSNEEPIGYYGMPKTNSYKQRSLHSYLEPCNRACQSTNYTSYSSDLPSYQYQEIRPRSNIGWSQYSLTYQTQLSNGGYLHPPSTHDSHPVYLGQSRRSSPELKYFKNYW